MADAAPISELVWDPVTGSEQKVASIWRGALFS